MKKDTQYEWSDENYFWNSFSFCLYFIQSNQLKILPLLTYFLCLKIATLPMYCELRCWRRLLRVLWTARRSNQSILKQISPKYSLEGLMLKLKHHLCEELTHWKRPWCWERLKAREGDNRGNGCIAPPTRWTWIWASSRSWWWTGKPGLLQSMGSQRVGHKWNELN